MTQKAKCPKCGEIEQVEITKTWGTKEFPKFLFMPEKIEIYCNTCGQVSIIDVEPS